MQKSALFPLLLPLACVLCLPACDKMESLRGTVVSTSQNALAEVSPSDGHHDAPSHGAPSHGAPSHGAPSHGASEHGASEHGGAAHHVVHKIVVTSPVAKDVVDTQQYVCRIHSWRHIEVKALEGGYLEKIAVKEGQAVKEGDVIFKILPTLYEAKLDAERAEAQLAEIELQNTEKLLEQKIVSPPEVALARAKLAKVQAKVKLTQAELDFASIKAPFDGIIDKQHEQQGSLIEEGAILTTLSDNSVMWAYFNVPEARYLAYASDPDRDQLKVELRLADGNLFPHEGKIGAVEADFNSETGNIAFRGDFSNPDHLLRHGQTGTVLLSRVVKDVIVIPQRATFEILAKRYAFVVGPDGVVRQRGIEIRSEQDDIYLIKDGLDVHDKIVLEGIRQVRDGDQIEYEFKDPEEVLGQLKYHAE